MANAAQNSRAALLVVGGIATFGINDAIVKLLTSRLPVGEIMSLRGIFVVILMLILLPLVGLRPGRPDAPALMRSVAEAGVNGFFIFSLYLLPLGETYTLYFTAPIMLTAAAALFTGERVGPGRWAAVLIGFLGILVAVGTPASWQPAILLPLVAAMLSVLRDLATRRVDPAVGSGTVALATAATVTIAGSLTLPLGWAVPDPLSIGLCLLAAVGAGLGYLLFVMGLRIGELSYVAPFRYAGIPCAMLLGLLFWGEVPEPRLLLGAAIIAGSGLFIAYRERMLARTATAAA